MKARSFLQYVLMPALLFATALNFRLRLGGSEVHIGGAEFAISPLDFAIVGLFFLLLVNLSKDGRYFKPDKFTSAALTFIFLSSLSVINSIAIEFTLFELIRHLKMLLLFVLLRKVFSNERVLGTLPALAFFLIMFEFAYSMLQMGSGSVDATEDAMEVKELFVEGGLVRVSGTLRHPNLLGLYINLLLPFLMVGVISGKRKLVYMAAVICLFVTLVFTYSRTQLALFFLILGVCAVYFKNDSGRSFLKNKKFIMGMVLFVFVLLVALAINFDSLYERFFNAPESNTATRVILLGIAVNMFLDNPIFGAGWNTFVYAMPKYDDYGAYMSFPYPVHNMYMLVLSETGILGLVSYLYLIYVAYAYHRSAARVSTRPDIVNYAKAAFIGVGIILITGLQGWSFRADSILSLLWIFFAVIAAVFDARRKFA